MEKPSIAVDFFVDERWGKATVVGEIPMEICSGAFDKETEFGDAELTGRIIGAAIEVHRNLGPGLLESVYEATLALELNRIGLLVERQKAVSIDYKGLKFDEGFRIDLLVAQKVVLELKCVEAILPIHEAQTISYLKLASLRIGLLINFKTPVLHRGIKRFLI